ncbi:MAG: LPS export ABC transporter periplasmic protein LptC [bacterium]
MIKKIFCLIFLIGCLSCKSQNTNYLNNVFNKMELKADYNLAGVVIKNNGDPNEDWELQSNKLFIFEKEDVAYLENVKIIFRTQGSTLNAKEAKFFLENENFIFKKNVCVVSNEGVKLKTELLEWDSKNKKFTTDKNVKIISKKGDIILGKGIEADMGLKVFKIKELKFN